MKAEIRDGQCLQDDFLITSVYGEWEKQQLFLMHKPRQVDL